MSDIGVFGTSALDVGAGYAEDPDHAAITVTTAFTVAGSLLTAGTIKGGRVYLLAGSPTNFAGARIGLWRYITADTNNTALVVEKAFSSPPVAGQWNSLLFDTPIDIDSVNPAGYPMMVGIYLPAGGYTFKRHVFDSNVVSAGSSSLVGQATANVLNGNGSYLSGAQAGSLPGNPSWGTFQATGYALDVIVDDGAPSGTTYTRAGTVAVGP